MKIRLVPIVEITMMSGPTAAADPALPQAALGQRPSDAYKNHNRGRKRKKQRLKRLKEHESGAKEYPYSCDECGHKGTFKVKNTPLPFKCPFCRKDGKEVTVNVSGPIEN
jgi:rubrerythrin